MDNSTTDTYFEYQTYEEYRKERLQLNYDSTLKLWYSLPTGLPTVDNKLVRRQTIKQQRSRLRKLKFFAFYCALLKKTFLRKKIQAKGNQNRKSNLFSALYVYFFVELVRFSFME